MKEDKNLSALLVKKGKQIMELKRELKHYHRSQGRYEYLYNDCKNKLKETENNYDLMKQNDRESIKALEEVIAKLESKLSKVEEERIKFFETNHERKLLSEAKHHKQKISLALFAFIIFLLFLLSTLLYV